LPFIPLKINALLRHTGCVPHRPAAETIILSIQRGKYELG
jgi:hypothetical protein